MHESLAVLASRVDLGLRVNVVYALLALTPWLAISALRALPPKHSPPKTFRTRLGAVNLLMAIALSAFVSTTGQGGPLISIIGVAFYAIGLVAYVREANASVRFDGSSILVRYAGKTEVISKDSVNDVGLIRVSMVSQPIQLRLRDGSNYRIPCLSWRNYRQLRAELESLATSSERQGELASKVDPPPSGDPSSGASLGT